MNPALESYTQHTPISVAAAPSDCNFHLFVGPWSNFDGDVAASGNIYYRLWYPIVVAVMTLVIGALFLRDSKNNSLELEAKH